MNVKSSHFSGHFTVCSKALSDWQQSHDQSSALLTFCTGNQSLHKGPEILKLFPCLDSTMDYELWAIIGTVSCCIYSMLCLWSDLSPFCLPYIYMYIWCTVFLKIQLVYHFKSHIYIHTWEWQIKEKIWHWIHKRHLYLIVTGEL